MSQTLANSIINALSAEKRRSDTSYLDLIDLVHRVRRLETENEALRDQLKAKPKYTSNYSDYKEDYV